MLITKYQIVNRKSFVAPNPTPPLTKPRQARQDCPPSTKPPILPKTGHESRATSHSLLHPSRTLYKSAHFMQNKPNLLNAQINVSSVFTKDYQKRSSPRTLQKQSQSNPIQTRSAAQIPTGELLGIFKPGTNQTQFQTFCWRCPTEKTMFCNHLNGKCQFKMAKT
jgi:hypothetical protein